MSDTLTGLPPATAANSGPMAMNSFSPQDPAKFLPTGAPADRYRALTQRFEDLMALRIDFNVRHQASLDRLAAEQRVKQLMGHRSVSGHELPDTDARVIAARKELEDRTAEQKRWNELDAVRSKAAQSCGTLLSNIKAWIGDGRPRGTSMLAITVPNPKMQKGETITAAIDRLRQQAKEQRAKLAEIERAPEPSAVARAKGREELAAIAARGGIDVCQLVGAGGKIGFPERQVTLKVYNSEPAAAAIGQSIDFLALLVRLNLDGLTAIMDKEIAAISDDRRALTTDQKQKQSVQVMDTLFAVELDEATLTLAAWQDGLPIEANPSITPSAWLAVANIVTPPPVDTSTSPQHGYNVIGR